MGNTCAVNLTSESWIRKDVTTKADLILDEVAEDDTPPEADCKILGKPTQKTLVEWTPEGCQKSLRTWMYVTSFHGAPDLSAGKKVIEEVDHLRKIFLDQVQYRQDFYEPSASLKSYLTIKAVNDLAVSTHGADRSSSSVLRRTEQDAISNPATSRSPSPQPTALQYPPSTAYQYLAQPATSVVMDSKFRSETAQSIKDAGRDLPFTDGAAVGNIPPAFSQGAVPSTPLEWFKQVSESGSWKAFLLIAISTMALSSFLPPHLSTAFRDLRALFRL